MLIQGRVVSKRSSPSGLLCELLLFDLCLEKGEPFRSIYAIVVVSDEADKCREGDLVQVKLVAYEKAKQTAFGLKVEVVQPVNLSHYFSAWPSTCSSLN